MTRSPVLAAALLVFSACGDPEAPQSPEGQPLVAVQPIPTEAPSIQGTITAVQQDGRIRVEEQPEEESGSAKAVIRLDEDSRVVYREGGAGGPGELAVGQRVSAWFTGPVAESYPVQATAAVVVIEP